MNPEEPFGLRVLCDKKAEEHFSKQNEERRKKIEAAMAQLGKDLGLSPGQSLWEHVGLFEPGTARELSAAGKDDVIGDSIEDFFEKLERVYVDGEAWEDHFPTSKTHKPPKTR